MGLVGAMWGYLRLSGAIWEARTIWGIWGSLGLSGARWGYLKRSGAIWGYLGLSGATWTTLGASKQASEPNTVCHDSALAARLNASN